MAISIRVSGIIGSLIVSVTGISLFVGRNTTNESIDAEHHVRPNPYGRPSTAREGSMPRRSLVVVANRLPVDETALPDGTVEWRRSPGGLVSALHPVLRDRHGVWIGWAGGIDSAPFVPDNDSIRMRSVPLSEQDYEDYYE